MWPQPPPPVYTLWNPKPKPRPRRRPLRPLFKKLRQDRKLLFRRRSQYVVDYARIANKLDFRERVVRELLHGPGGPSADTAEECEAEMQRIRTLQARHTADQQWRQDPHRDEDNKPAPLTAREKRLVAQQAKADVHQTELDECQLLYFAFQFEVQGRACIHIQKIWRGCVPRQAFRARRRRSRLALATCFVALHRIPGIQPTIRVRIDKWRRDLFLKRRKASFTISHAMKRHLRIMKTLRWLHRHLDIRIVQHKREIASCVYLQQWYRRKMEDFRIMKKALAYSAKMREAEQRRKRSKEQQAQVEASKVIQEWNSIMMIKKHRYVNHVYSRLHKKMRENVSVV